MGCTLSSDSIILAQDKELKDYLNQKDIELVQHSWNFVQDDLEHIGLMMFQRYYHLIIYEALPGGGGGYLFHCSLK